MLDRLMRRASLPISFDGGYHPHPRIIAAAALPFGMTADEDLIDFFLAEEMLVDDFTNRVNSALPTGMCVVSAVSIPVGASAMSALMESADYLVAVYRDCNATQDGSDVVDWEEVMHAVHASGPVEVEKINKKGVATVRNLRDMLLSARIAQADESGPVLTHIGIDEWPLNGVIFAVKLCLSNERTLSPSAFVNLLQICTGDNRLVMLHAHRVRINFARDERYERALANRALESARLQQKARTLEDDTSGTCRAVTNSA
jgi:radical SAM-linked protein